MLRPLLAVFCCLLVFQGLCQYNGKIPSDYYVEFGGGTAIWNNSRISNASVENLTVFLYGEIGRFASPFSIIAGYDFLTSYGLGSFELNPSYAFAHLKVNLKRIPVGPYQAVLFGFLGPAFERTKLAVEATNQVLVDQSETKSGLAFTGGLGAQLELGAFTLATRGLVYRGRRQFLAGGFETQAYQTGSERLLITLGYKFKRCESSFPKCGTFR